MALVLVLLAATAGAQQPEGAGLGQIDWPLATITADPSATLTIDFAVARDGNPSRFGLLHGLDGDSPPDALIRPLRPGLIRAADDTQVFEGGTPPLSRSLELAEVYNLVLSDAWGYPPGWIPPYDDLDRWRTLVTTTIEREEIATAAGSQPERILFEPWNEPDVPLFWDGTEEQFFDVFLAAERAIREVHPEALVAGPSYGFFGLEKIKRFLDSCLAHGARVDVLTFHAFHLDVVSLGEDLADVRREILDDPRYAPLGIRGVVINEFAFVTHDLLPAENLGFLYHLEEGGVLRGARACWGNCFDDSLDGLLTAEGQEPRAVWWVFRAYADGVDSRVASASTDRQIVAIASREGPDPDAAQVLIGHIGTAAGRPPSSISVTLRGLAALRNPSNGACVDLVGRRIAASGEEPVGEPIIDFELRSGIDFDETRVTLPSSLDEHEVLILSVRRVACVPEPATLLCQLVALLALLALPRRHLAARRVGRL